MALVETWLDHRDAILRHGGWCLSRFSVVVIVRTYGGRNMINEEGSTTVGARCRSRQGHWVV